MGQSNLLIATWEALHLINRRGVLIYFQFSPIVHATAINLGQKWQRTHVGKKILSANKVRQHAPRGAWVFFLLGEGVDVGIFLLKSMCSHEIPMGSQ